MKQKATITILVLCIAVFGIIASASGIFSGSGAGEYEYKSIRGQLVTIYGKGLYQHMSADVAVQGIAQDYVTLFIAIPLLIFALFRAFNGTTKSTLFLAGVLNYFLLTYLFYLNMAMFNKMFLVYVVLTGTSFFAFILTLLSIDVNKLSMLFSKALPHKFIGSFLIFTASCIALLWLGVVVPPLLDNTIVPAAVEHYTTLTVQGFDLSIFLPINFLAGVLLIKRQKFGYLMASVSLVFLSLLMTALIAKIIAMALVGVNVIPAIFIIPGIALLSVICGTILFKNIIGNSIIE